MPSKEGYSKGQPKNVPLPKDIGFGYPNNIPNTQTKQMTGKVQLQRGLGFSKNSN